MLFGDAAGAMVVGPSEDPDRGLLSAHLHSDGNAADILTIRGGGSRHPVSTAMIEDNLHKIAMSGREVYRFAVRVLPDALMEAFEANHVLPSQIDHVVSHQANLRIVRIGARSCRHPRVRAAGPTSSATATRPRLRYRFRSTRRTAPDTSSRAISSP